MAEAAISEEEIFGKVLKEFRLASGKTQEMLALDAGLDRTYISMLERGKSSPTLSVVRAIALSLNVSMKEIVEIYEGYLSEK